MRTFIWEEEKYHELQGVYPIDFISFADVGRIIMRMRFRRLKILLWMCIDSIASLEQQSAFLSKRSEYIVCHGRNE